MSKADKKAAKAGAPLIPGQKQEVAPAPQEPQRIDLNAVRVNIGDAISMLCNMVLERDRALQAAYTEIQELKKPKEA
jgi:hypothetical protein